MQLHSGCLSICVSSASDLIWFLQITAENSWHALLLCSVITTDTDEDAVNTMPGRSRASPAPAWARSTPSCWPTGWTWPPARRACTRPRGRCWCAAGAPAAATRASVTASSPTCTSRRACRAAGWGFGVCLAADASHAAVARACVAAWSPTCTLFTHAKDFLRQCGISLLLYQRPAGLRQDPCMLPSSA